MKFTFFMTYICFVSILKSIREEKGYTQTDLAKKTGLSLRTIQRLESSDKVPKGFTLTTLAKEFEIEPSDLQGKYVLVKRSKDSEIRTINTINFSILSFLGIPFGNLILPLIIWRNHKNSEFIDDVGRRIVNFQILFTLVLNVLLILSPFTLSKMLPSIPVLLLILILAYLFNIVIVIQTAIKIKRQNFDFLNLPIRFL